MTLALTMLLAATVYHVGGDVKAPVVIKRVEARIPPHAKCRGLVVVDLIVDEKGVPQNVRDASRNPDVFTRAQADAVRQWRFRPATLHGKAVAVTYTATVNFRCQ